MKNTIDRREVLASASALALVAPAVANAQGAPAAPAPAAAPAAPAGPANTNWTVSHGDNGARRYSPLDQINASNFNRLEVAWRFSTDNYGPRGDAYFNASPLVVNGRLYCPMGLDRYLVCMDAGTGQLLWVYRHDEKGRLGARGGSGWGAAYWTDGTNERILYCTRSYQLISLDVKTGRPDPNFGDGMEVDLRKDWDHEVDPVRSVVGIHAPPMVVRDTVVVGNASASTGPGHLRGYDVKTGKRKWIFHTVPQKGEFGYETWLKPGQAEGATNTGVWAPMSADPELGLVYAGVELPQADAIGITRHGASLFSETLVALDIETGERKWHYQLEHHGIWDRDVPAAGVLLDVNQGGKIVKAIAQPTKQGFLFVFDRATGKPLWPIVEKKAEAGDIPNEWYSPTQPWPSKPPAFEHQGFALTDVIDWTPEIKARAEAVASQYHMGPLYTPPTLVKEEMGRRGTITTPENQGGANWPGGSGDPETGVVYLYSKSIPQLYGNILQPDGRLTGAGGTGRGTNDSAGGGFGGQAGPARQPTLGGVVPATVKDGLNDPITRGLLTVGGMSILKPPWGRITALDLKTGNMLWQVAHGETPDFVTNNPLLKGVKVPRTGQSGILGVMTTKTLVICGDAGVFTDEQGRKAARLRAYDKATGQEVGAVFMDQAQTGSPITYIHGGRQHIVVASGGWNGSELIAYRLPAPPAAPAAGGGQGGGGGGGQFAD